MDPEADRVQYVKDYNNFASMQFYHRRLRNAGQSCGGKLLQRAG